MTATPTQPYGDAAVRLLDAGWRGPLPLPYGAKAPPPPGTTGAHAPWLSGADVYAHTEDRPGSNVALRMPPTVIGIDVDAYEDKHGGDTLAEAAIRWGQLPPTWVITSRDDEVSGIRLYRVPPGRHWPGEVGPHVEVIQTRHRYAVAPPSLHPEGRTYRWVRPDGYRCDPHTQPPRLDELAELPKPWVDGLSGGRLAVDVSKGDVSREQAFAWYSAEHNAAVTGCGLVRTTVARALAELRDSVRSRHDTGLRVVMRLAYATTEGHRGVVGALEQVRTAWFDAVTAGTAARSEDEADREWTAIMSGALAVLAADGALGGCDEPDPCANPLAGLLMPAQLHAGLDTTTYAVGSAPRTPWDAPAAPLPPETGLVAPDVDPPRADVLDALVAREAIMLRARRAARIVVDREEVSGTWREPDGFDTLTEDLDLPDEPLTWMVDDLMPVGSNVVLTAQFKAGKTTMLNHLVGCLVDQRDFLGRHATHPLTGRVGLWNYEVGPGMYRRWLRDVGMGRTDLVTLLNLRGYTMPITDPYVQSWIVQWLKSRNITVWILDPFARALLGSGEENSNAEVGAFLETIDIIKAKAGVRDLIMTAHTGRAEMTPGAERARGATRLDDWADVRWILTSTPDGTRFFRASGRDVETDETALEYDLATRALTLTNEGRPEPQLPGARAPKTPENLFNAFVAVIETNPGIGKAELFHKVKGAGYERKTETLQRLVQQGLVVIRDGGSGRRAEHFLGTPGMGYS